MKKKVNIKHVFICALSALIISAAMFGCGNAQNESMNVSEIPEPVVSETESDIEEVREDDVYLAGTTYGGVDISGLTYKEALALCSENSDEFAEKFKKFTVTVKATDDEENEISCTIKGSDLTYTDKTEVKLAEMIVHDIKGDVDMALEFKSDEVKTLLTDAFAEYDVEAKDAKITGVSDGKVTYESAVTGKKINVDKTTELVITALKELDGSDITPEFDIIEPELTDEILDKYKRIGAYSTNIVSNQSESIYNMKLAFRIVDGTVLYPGETFSFMHYMDYADSYGGFQAGNVIMNGILVPSSGGGICQASTTLYGVALDAGMTIVERNNHGIPSSYVQKGLDAMVSSGYSDFRFRNDYSTPIYLDTAYGERTMYAYIYGLQPEDWDDIACDSWVTETIDPVEGVRFIIDSNLKEGQFELQNSASNGYRAAAQRYYYKDGALVKTENLTSSYYPPRQKTYTIGKGTDTTTLEDGTETRTSGTVATPTPEPTETPTPSPSPSTAPTPEATVTPTPTPEVTVTPTPEVTTDPTPTPEATVTPTEEPTVSTPETETPAA